MRSRRLPLTTERYIVGAGKLEDENGMLAFIAEHELRSRVRHSRGLGTQAVVEAMEENLNFLFLPTRIDSGPTALKEALTMCLWPICYDGFGPGEYIRKYSFGSLVSDGNVSELSEKLAHSFATERWRDEDLRMKLAQRTRGTSHPTMHGDGWKEFSNCERPNDVNGAAL